MVNNNVCSDFMYGQHKKVFHQKYCHEVVHIVSNHVSGPFVIILSSFLVSIQSVLLTHLYKICSKKERQRLQDL